MLHVAIQAGCDTCLSHFTIGNHHGSSKEMVTGQYTLQSGSMHQRSPC